MDTAYHFRDSYSSAGSYGRQSPSSDPRASLASSLTSFTEQLSIASNPSRSSSVASSRRTHHEYLCEHCGRGMGRSTTAAYTEHLTTCTCLGRGLLAYECSVCFRLLPNHRQAILHNQNAHNSSAPYLKLDLPGKRRFASCFNNNIFDSFD
ncbi:hypothetical protein BAUCODRAFT_133588, partial [Baudoinia panamericana UAMH 10762]